MPDEHPNATPVRALFEAFERRNAAAITEAIPEDAVWRFPGRRGGLAGEHRGRQAILMFLANVMALTAGTFKLELHDITVGEKSVIALFTGHGVRDGKTLDNPTCLRFDMRDGKIAEIWEFVLDLEHVEAFWS